MRPEYSSVLWTVRVVMTPICDLASDRFSHPCTGLAHTPMARNKKASRAEAMVMWRSGSLTGLGEDEDNCMARAWSLQKREEIKERGPLPLQ